MRVQTSRRPYVDRRARRSEEPVTDLRHPDAPVGTWVHWVLYDLPVTTAELTEKMSASDKLPNGAKQGMNDFKRVGYGGPCPPPGKPHRYYFKLYALDTVLELKPGQLRRICCAPWKVILLPKLSLWEFTAGDSPPFD